MVVLLIEVVIWEGNVYLGILEKIIIEWKVYQVVGGIVRLKFKRKDLVGNRDLLFVKEQFVDIIEQKNFQMKSVRKQG